jgi:hypothetical protein
MVDNLPMSFEGLEARTPFEANNARSFAARANVALTYTAERRSLADHGRLDEDYLASAIARLAIGGEGSYLVWAPTPGSFGGGAGGFGGGFGFGSANGGFAYGSGSGSGPGMRTETKRGDNLDIVNDALFSAVKESHPGSSIDSVPIILDLPGEYDVVLRGLIPIIYRYSHKLRPEVRSHILNNLLTVRGDRSGVNTVYFVDNILVVMGWETIRIGSGLVRIEFPETENHILQIESSRYLTNQLLQLEAWREGRYDARFDNEMNGMNDWILRQFQAFLRFDFWEYNARPYQRYSTAAIHNLFDYAWDDRVKTAAGMVLDYVSAKFAVSSNGLRRCAPYRRLRDTMAQTNLFVDKADTGTYGFTLLSGYMHVLPYAHDWAAPDMTMVSLSDYRVPDIVLDLIMTPDHRSYFQRFSHGTRTGVVPSPANGVRGGIEVYSSEPEYLISAGGVWRESGYGYDEFQKYKSCAWPLPTTIMPSRAGLDIGGLDRSDFLKIFGYDNTGRTTVNLGVAPNFAWGFEIVIPDSLTANAIIETDGKWTFIHREEDGIFFAVYRDPEWAGGFGGGFGFGSANGGFGFGSGSGMLYPNWGFVEVARAKSLRFRDFVQSTKSLNAWRTYSPNGAVNEYVTLAGRTVKFSGAAQLLELDGSPLETDTDRWPLAEGDIINSRKELGDSGHSGYVRVDNPSLQQRLVLDMQNHLIPRRYQYRLDAPRQNSGFVVSRDMYRFDLYWVGNEGRIMSAAWDSYVNNSSVPPEPLQAPWSPIRGLTEPGCARWNSPVISIAKTSESTDLFWIHPNGAVWSMTWDKNLNGGDWSFPFEIAPPGATRFNSPLAALGRHPEQLDVFWIDPSGAVATTYWNKDPDGPWNSPGKPFKITPDGATRNNSPLCAIARDRTIMDVFWIGPDGAVGSTYWNTSDTGNWDEHAPFGITRPGATRGDSSLAACALDADHMNVFWIDPHDSVVRAAWDSEANWTPPMVIAPKGSVRSPSPLAAVSRSPDQMDVFWVTPDSAIGSTWWNGQRDIGEWNQHSAFSIAFPNSARIDTPLTAVARLPNTLDVFWLGKDGAFGSNAYATDQVPAWNDRQAYGITEPSVVPPARVPPAGQSPPAICDNAAEMSVFWPSSDGNVETSAWLDRNANWAWTMPARIALSNPKRGRGRARRHVSQVAPTSKHVVALSPFPGRFDVFWIGQNGAVWSSNWSIIETNRAWTEPVAITPDQVARRGSPLAAVSRRPDRIDVFWIAPDGAIASTYRDDDPVHGAWTPKDTTTKPFKITPSGSAGADSSLAAVSCHPDQIDVFWIDRHGAVASTYWNLDPIHGDWRHGSFEPGLPLVFKAGAVPDKPFSITRRNTARSGSPLVALSRDRDQIDVFWIGPDDAIASTYWNAGPGGSWLLPDQPILNLNNRNAPKPFKITPPHAARSDSPLAAVSRFRDQMDVFWIDRSGAVASTYWNTEPTHGDWLPGPPDGDVRHGVHLAIRLRLKPFTITAANAARQVSFIAAVARSPDQLDVFWTGPDGAIGSNFAYSNQTNSWNGGSAFPISPVGVVR